MVINIREYDVIIIGGGLSGSTLGYLLKKQNKKVLIIEKQNIKSKDKLCGGLLTKKSFDLLSEIFNKKDINGLLYKSLDNVIINNNNDKLIIPNVGTSSIYRKDLDDYVINQYLDVGGDLIDNTVYQSINSELNLITINNETYKYNFLVGADGVFSQLRKDITGKNQRGNFALEINEKNLNKKLEIYFFNRFKGYAWIIPNCKQTLIGIIDVSSNFKIENNFNDYLKLLNIKKNDRKGAFLPTGNDIFLKQKNIFFVGDSAGLISPITGEGIYYALRSSFILSENMNDNYFKKMKPFIKEIRLDLFFLRFVYNDKIRNYLFSRYNGNKLINKLINRFARHIL